MSGRSQVGSPLRAHSRRLSVDCRRGTGTPLPHEGHLAASTLESVRGFVARHDERGRFLAVGIWNTVFGLAVLRILEQSVPHHPASILQKQAILAASWLIGATQNFFTFKLLVIRTRGNCLREYARIYLTYAGTFAVQSVLVQSISAYFHLRLQARAVARAAPCAGCRRGCLMQGAFQ